MKLKDRYLTASSDRDTCTIFSGQDSPIPDLSGSTRSEELPQPLVIATKQALPVLQTVKLPYSRAVDYLIYRLAICSTSYDETVSTHISEMVNKDMSQINAHIFNLGDPISISAFLATFKLTCDTNRIHEEAAVWILSIFV